MLPAARTRWTSPSSRRSQSGTSRPAPVGVAVYACNSCCNRVRERCSPSPASRIAGAAATAAASYATLTLFDFFAVRYTGNKLAWRRAALCWHWGKFVFVDHPDEQRAAHDRAVACYRSGAAGLQPPAMRVTIPYDDTSLPAYLRLPATAAAAKPVVIMLPGLDSTKEELQANAEYMLARGLATIAVDGPGQGFHGHSRIVDPTGQVMAEAAGEGVATATIALRRDLVRHRARSWFGQVFLRDQHRCCAEAVTREHAGDVRTVCD